MADETNNRATTLGELQASGWVSRPVKQEVREHAIAKVIAGEPLFTGVQGYENTVMPQLENALLAGHDVVFLGERGQAKTRMIRSLTGLLDEWMPIVAGSEIMDDPYNPVSKYAKDLVAEHGDATPVDWVHRDLRYGEKLATPDIFAINELPDLSERIQVGLLNVLEERDVQIRGYKIRLPLDVMLMASANPEDYTNRGRIITPLKDRFGSQIRTHYPLDVQTEIDIMLQEAASLDVDTPNGVIKVTVPDYLTEVVATFSHLARSSNQVNQRSGVSVRLSVSNYEAMAANALRRGLRSGETSPVARVDDLGALAASSMGKIEIESIEEGRDGVIMESLIKGAVLTVFKDTVPPEHTRAVVDAFEEGAVAHTGESMISAELAAVVEQVDALRAPVAVLTGGDESPASVAAAVEFILEGLHLSKRLNKDASGGSATYRSRT